jgi:hypothetical protein
MNSIDYQSDILERFIPVSIDELVANLMNRKELSIHQKHDFQLFCQQYRALYQAQSLPTYQRLTRYYAPFNPDIEGVNHTDYSDEEQQNLERKLLDQLSELLNDANYEKLTLDQLTVALSETSPYGVEVVVDFDDFSEMLLFYQGSAINYEQQRDWKQLFLKQKTVEVKIYRRLFILLKLKPLWQKIEELAATKSISLTKAESQIKRKPSQNIINDDKIYIKLFKNIPCSDLEMLFPNTKIKMRLFDKLKLGITGGGGTAGGIITIISKLAVAIDPIAMATAIFGFAGLLWRQVSKFFLQRTKYMAELAKNLYYYNLDNNLGAIAHIHDMAAASEAKETLLSYFFLMTQGSMSISTLDKKIEQFISNEYGVAIDFEVEDGLEKLKKLGVLIQANDQVSVVSLMETKTILQQHWLACF